MCVCGGGGGGALGQTRRKRHVGRMRLGPWD